MKPCCLYAEGWAALIALSLSFPFPQSILFPQLTKSDNYRHVVHTAKSC